jgi:predicted RNA-binding Zn-ribbon protein involved in translation (DUF1610 family)
MVPEVEEPKAPPQEEVPPPLEEPKPEEEQLEPTERECPQCGTLISMKAITCFACGMELEMTAEPETQAQVEEPSMVSEPEEKPEVEEGGDEKLPSKEELYTMSDDQLVALGKTLGVNTDGRAKHLRERLIEYIEGGEKKEEAKGEVSAHVCPDCGGELTYVEQYDAWYCPACEKYAPSPEDV